MFIGHFGAGFAAKKVTGSLSLGTMFFAAQFLDLIWPIFILTGLETVKIVPGSTSTNPLDFTFYPYSHSLLMVLIWAFLFGSIYYLTKKNLRSSVILGLLVVSHWILDLIVHNPDLPLDPWSGIKVGLGLWNFIPLSVLIELLIFAGGVFLYISSTSAINKKGTYGLWILIIFFVVVYFLNLTGPPPPSIEALGYAGLLQWLFIPWAYWIDRNRKKIVNDTISVSQPVQNNR